MFFKLTFAWIYFYFLIKLCDGSLADVSSKVLGGFTNGIIAAFGDFNADKATDIFTLSDDGKTLSVLLGHVDLTEGPFTHRTLIAADDVKGFLITNVVPADFDGDSMMDILVTMKPQDGNTVTVRIFWGGGMELTDSPLTLNETFRDQPTVVDANGDMIPDLFGEDKDDGRAFWIFDKNRKYVLSFVKNGTESSPLPALHVPQGSAFLDFNEDFAPDLIVMSEDSQRRPQFELWYNVEGVLQWNHTVAIPDQAVVVGQPSFFDMNGDHELDLILPACSDEACTTSMVYVLSRDKWHKLKIQFKRNDKTWNFVDISRPQTHPWLQVPATLRYGDYSLNTYPDAVAVLAKTDNKNKTYGAFFLENVNCEGNDCEGFSRTFYINFDHPLLNPGLSHLLVAFFDLLDNGVLDILVNSIEPSMSQIHALQQTFAEDACFMKVMVVSGLCNEDCPIGHKPYGVNQVGPVVRFQTTTADGGSQIGVASQLTQWAYFSLQLPFIHFGLGQMPNFVDKLEVGIQYPQNGTSRHREWTQIIPNSQLVIIPYPPSSPELWVNKLFVTPSRLVLLTGAALLGTCGFIAGIIGILHWRERAEDKKEKLQEAHKFHFDAM